MAMLIPHARLHTVRGGGYLVLLGGARQMGPVITSFRREGSARGGFEVAGGPGGSDHGDDDADGGAMDQALRSAALMYAGDQAARALGISIDEVAPGRATARMRVTGDMTNGHRIAHGGYIFLLADAAFA
jgi:hypothetical protein